MPQIAPGADIFGLPPCLQLPIAANSLMAISAYVGKIVATKVDGQKTNAVCVENRDFKVPRTPGVKLWLRPDGSRLYGRLHPKYEVWVDVDYTNYVGAYKDFQKNFQLWPIYAGFFLDHIQNRKAIRLRGYTHRYLRLCPISRAVNTSGGSDYGGEGMEKEYIQAVLKRNSKVGAPADLFSRSPIIYADPMDITKMLNIEPGYHNLAGVGRNQADYFAPTPKKK